MSQPIVILLVEDELPIRKLISELLHGSGYRVLAASSGPDAIQAVSERKGPVDLLLTDIELGKGMSGIQLAEYLVALRPGLRVMLMSGSPSQLLAFKDSTTFVCKPFSPADLMNKIEGVLSQG